MSDYYPEFEKGKSGGEVKDKCSDKMEPGD